MSAVEIALAKLVEEVFRESLVDLDPARLVANALPKTPNQDAHVHILAAGKAAAKMARGALERWEDRVRKTLVITVDGSSLETDDLELTTLPTVVFASHPLPDERSEMAALAALEFARELGPHDLLLALISGGSSSLLSLPPRGVDRSSKLRLVQTLLERGAPITDVNLVRRHFSGIKGGRLALAAAPATVWTLALGDVVGGVIADVGSGPTVPDPTTAAEARDVLVRFAPELVQEGLDRFLADVPGPTRFPVRTEALWLAGPDDLSRVIAARLRARGFYVDVLKAEGGNVVDVTARRIAQARALAPRQAIVVPCEPTVVLPKARGRGGRAGFVALAAMAALPPGVVLLCGASDGVDGSSAAAGAVVSSSSAAGVDAALIERALAQFDDANVHEMLGTSIKMGPTGQNLTDVHVLARA